MGEEGDGEPDERASSPVEEPDSDAGAAAEGEESRDEPPAPDGEGEPGEDGGSGRLWDSYATGGDGSPSGATTDGAPAAPGDGPTADATEPDATEGERRDSDRVWNRRRSAGGDRPADATGGDRPADGDAAGSATGSSFDHLLERSAGGAASGSGPMETDIEAFFSDLGEFDRATSGSQVLVISPRDHSITDEVCSQFLTTGDVSGRNVMFVTTAEPPAERLRICRDSSEWTGGEVAVIELGDVGGSSDLDDTVNGHPVVHKRVNSPKNFSKAGLLITQTLKKWSNSSRPTALCFHTLTAISGYVQNEVLFQFLFTLQAKLNSLGVTGHYHMDTNRHDQQELNTLKTVFDLVIEVSPDGEIEVE